MQEECDLCGTSVSSRVFAGFMEQGVIFHQSAFFLFCFKLVYFLVTLFMLLYPEQRQVDIRHYLPEYSRMYAWGNLAPSCW